MAGGAAQAAADGGQGAQSPWRRFVAARRVLLNLEEEEANLLLGVDLADIPSAPVKVKLSLDILE